jgi:hypothetical protein
LYTFFFSPVTFFGGLLAPGDAVIYYLPNFFREKVLWEPLISCGFPMFADPQAMTWYPPSAIFSFLSHSWNIFVISAYVLASAFAYGFVYTLTGSRLSGFVSGMIYGMSGFMMGHLGHTSVIHTAAWLPLFLWALEILRRKFSYGWFAVLSFSVGLGALAGHPQILFYMLGLGAIYAICFGWSTPYGRWKYYILCLTAVGLGLALTAVQFIPAAELATLGPRAKMAFEEFISFSIPPNQIVGLLYPYLYGNMAQSMIGGSYFGKWNIVEVSGYVGLLPLMLAGIGFVCYRRDARAWFWLAIAFGAFLLSVGDATPLAKIMYRVPIYNRFRAPARHLIEITIALSVLAGFGVLSFQRGIVKRRLILAILTAGIGVMVFSLFGTTLWMRTNAARAGNITLLPWNNPAAGIPVLIFITAGILLYIWYRCKASWHLQTVILCLLIIDLSSFGFYSYWRYISPKKEDISAPPHAERYRKVLNGSNQRIFPLGGGFSGFHQFHPNTSKLWGIPSASGYGPLPLSRVVSFLSMSGTGTLSSEFWRNEKDRSMDIMAVRYIVMPAFERFAGEGGFTWAKDDLSVFLGAQCGSLTEKFYRLSLRSPVKATALGIVSALSCSVEIPDGSAVGSVMLTDIHGNVRSMSLRAGIDTSEWAFDCSDVHPQMKHRRASIFRSFPVSRESSSPCEGHHYLTTLSLEERIEVKTIDLEWGGIPGGILFLKMSFLDQQTGQSYPVSIVESLWSDKTRWKHIEDVLDGSFFENLKVLPRTWLVPETVLLKEEEVLRAIKTSQMPDGRIYDPLKMALVERPVNLNVKNMDPEARAQITHLSDSKIEISTKAASSSFLVLSDVYYPGWKATIDGVRTRIFQTNYVQRGVMVPSGIHVVRFEFRPKTFYQGLFISIAALVIIAGIPVYLHFRKR